MEKANLSHVVYKTISYKDKPKEEVKKTEVALKRCNSDPLDYTDRQTLFQVDEPMEQLKTEMPDLQFEMKVDDSGEKIRFFYPSILDGDIEYFRDHILLEFGVRNEIDPQEKEVVLIVGKPSKVKWAEDVFSEAGTVKWSLFEVTIKDFEVVFGQLEKKKIKTKIFFCCSSPFPSLQVTLVTKIISKTKCN